jgi:hypothetical protein
VEMTACKQSSSSRLIPFISLLVIRVRLMRITEAIAYQLMLHLYCFQIHRSYLLELLWELITSYRTQLQMGLFSLFKENSV